jgi:hypothetical protein
MDAPASREGNSERGGIVQLLHAIVALGTTLVTGSTKQFSFKR